MDERNDEGNDQGNSGPNERRDGGRFGSPSAEPAAGLAGAGEPDAAADPRDPAAPPAAGDTIVGVIAAGGERSGGLRRAVSRRQLLAWSLAIAAAAAAAPEFPALLRRTAGPAAGPPALYGLTRPQDQLALRWELLNLRLYKAGEAGPGDPATARLAIADSTLPAFLVVHFPAQHVAERAYLSVDPNFPGQGGDESALLTTPVPAALSGESRLAFRVPAGAGPIPFTPDSLLTWSGLTPSVVPGAARTVTGRPAPQAPLPSQTAIEAPWGLVLSPDDGAGWAHSVTPVTHGGRTELWHTRLGVAKGPAVDERGAQVRAVWMPGFQAKPPGWDDPLPPGRTSLTARQRYEIVRLSSDHAMDVIIPGGSSVKPYKPRPVAANRLMLSTMGAWLDADGSWDEPLHASEDYQFSVEQWLHRATMGRDHYVKVVNAGFLFPFGHRASLVTVTERAFEPVPKQSAPQLAAFSRQRLFVVIREPERTYAGTAFQPQGGRSMPWTKVRITTQVTPNLTSPDGANPEPLTRVPADPGYGQPFFGRDAFWPVVPSAAGPKDFLFAIEAEDALGQRCQFTAPLIFVGGGISDKLEHTGKVVSVYAGTNPTRRERPLGGQKVALTTLPGDSTYPVDSVTLFADLPDPVNASLDYRRQPRFFPVLNGMAVHLTAAEQIAGKPAAPAPSRIMWHPGYLSGLPNPSQLFAKLVNPILLSFPADAVGALATPDLSIGGLSALTGLTGGGNLPDLLPAKFDPEAFFAGAFPKILGALPLTAIIDAVGFDALAQLPKLVKTELPDAIQTSYTWRPKIKGDENLHIFAPAREDGLSIRAVATVRRSGGPPSFEVVGELTDFAINALGTGDLGMLTISFRKLRFASRDGQKATVEADMSGVQFHGVLEFINPLQDFLASLGIVPPRTSKAAGKRAIAADPPPNGPDISVTAQGIRAGYNLALPKVPLGVFLLENIALSAVLNIPFLGDPARVRFAFADRERPFLLTVAMFGGGGFCALQLGLDGFERLEAALEFGAKFALDLGVASGGVSAMAGIYFALGPSKGELSGYVRINGELHVLGLISLGLEFYLGLSYQTDTGEVSGQARLTVSVDIAFFSTSVTLGPIEKRFGGGSPAPKTAAKQRAISAAAPAVTPPGLADLMSQSDWADPATGYCSLFAPAAFA